MTSPNNLGAGSEGALVVANNVTIRYPDVLEPRRGQEAVPDVVEPPTEIAQCQYVGGVAYVVDTSTPHGYSNGQTVIVNTGTLDQPHTVTINGGVSTTAFTVVSPQNWPFPPDEYVFTYPLAGEPSFPVSQVSFFEDKVVLHSADLGKIKVLGEASTLTGDYLAADPDYRLKTAIAASTFYMATDKGVMALEDSTSTVPRLSGIAEPLKPAAGAVVDATSPAPTIRGFLAPEKAVAYRVLFGYVDSHGAPHFGPPSVRVTIKNSSTTEYATGKLLVPLYTAPVDAAGAIVLGTFVRVYRSVMADTEALTSDELYLVNETVIDTTQYTTSSVLTLADTAEQAFAVQSAPLYTNATQGFLPNDPPPFARDLATWSEREWYANTEQPFSLTAQLIGVEGGGTPTIPATGIRIGDTLTINGVIFTAWGSTIYADRKFAVWTSGSAAENISITLEQLQDVVNDWHKNNVSFDIWAYLEPVVFGDQLLNFKIRFQRPSVDSTVNTAFSVDYNVLQNDASVYSSGGGYYQVQTTTIHNLLVDDWVRLFDGQGFDCGTFKVTNVLSLIMFEIQSASALVLTAQLVFRAYGASVWTPDLSAGVAADNERRSDYVYYSLPGEPEAVSAANYLTVGTSGKAIRRIVPQRDRLLVFKDEGTYAVYGDFPYQVSLVDDTMAILAPDSAVAIGSTVIALMEDGIMAVSDGGIQMISKVIDSTLKPYGAAPYRSTTRTAFGVAYESEKVFALFMPTLSGAGADYTARAYVYGFEGAPGGAWTTWSFSTPRLCGRVDPFSDTAYYGVSASPYLFKDKNTSSTADYFDSTGAITSTVQWAATTLGAPHFTKQARELHVHFREVAASTNITSTFSLKTDIVAGGESVSLPVASAFSLTSIIGRPVLPQQKRVLIPQNVQRATYYTLGMIASTESPGGYWALNGYSIVYEGTSERTGTVR